MSIAYSVAVDADLRGAHVQACARDARPRALEPIVGSAERNLVSSNTTLSNGELLFGSETECVSYEAKFRSAPYISPDGRFALLSQTDWLWRPVPMPNNLEAIVSFSLPGDMQVSVPWPKEDSGEYRLSESAFRLSSYNVVGSFQRSAYVLEGVRVRVADLGSQLPQAALVGWLRSAIRMVFSVGEAFPASAMQVIVAPGGPGIDPVAFGMVRRGGGISVLLLPNHNASPASLKKDWVLVHELSHLWMPRLDAGARWLSEGIATYLQEVLRANCGAQTADVAWDKIRSGFHRGRRIRSRRTLVEESLSMSRTGNYHRVYWAGAAFALEADLRLRRESGGRITLLTALERGHERWKDSVLESADDVLRVMDDAVGTSFLQKLGRDYALRRSFPDTSRLLSGTSGRLRRQIMAADPACVASLAAELR